MCVLLEGFYIPLTNSSKEWTVMERDEQNSYLRRFTKLKAIMVKDKCDMNTKIQDGRTVANQWKMDVFIKRIVSENNIKPQDNDMSLSLLQERENRDLLENYRSATSEAQRWETEASQRSGESSTVKVELMTRDSEIKRLRENLLHLERDLQQVRFIRWKRISEKDLGRRDVYTMGAYNETLLWSELVIKGTILSCSKQTLTTGHGIGVLV